ncbi:MAG TPA: FAD-dependent oxidoreductase [bacterium]|nr:FAD-dependent oxidoreductase [bacterium]
MPDSADVVVVGGGMIGVCCAYEIRRLGRSVVLLERGEIGGATASASGGGVLCHTKNLPLLIALTWKSMRLYEALREDAGVPYEVNGSYVPYRSEAEAVFVRERVDWLTREGVRVESLDAAELRARMPHLARDVLGASYAPDDAIVPSRDACLAVAGAAAARGASIRPHTEVRGFDVVDDRVRGVVTAAGVIGCGDVVLAAGPWTLPLAAGVGVDVPIHFEKGEMLVTSPVPYELRGRVLAPAVLAAKFATNLTEGHFSVGLAVGQDPDRSIRLGATRELSGFDLTPSSRAREALLEEFGRFFPSLMPLPVVGHTVGLRPVGSHKRPIVARCPRPAGLILACAHGGDGIALAPVTGWLVAQMLAGAVTGFEESLGLS